MKVSTKSIEESHISRTMRKSYVRTLVEILIWLMDNHPEKVVELDQFSRAKEEYWGHETKKHLRSECFRLLELMELFCSD